MSLVIRQLFKLLKLLNSERGANQIAAGVVLGLILGLSPLLSLQALLVVVCLFLFRVQLGAALLTAFFVEFLAYIFAPLFHRVGAVVLSSVLLKPVFTYLYNLPLVPLTRFNNSVVMGAGIVSLLLAVPLFFVVRWLIASYRQQVVERFKETRIWHWMKATSVYEWYCRYDRLFG